MDEASVWSRRGIVDCRKLGAKLQRGGKCGGCARVERRACCDWAVRNEGVFCRESSLHRSLFRDKCPWRLLAMCRRRVELGRIACTGFCPILSAFFPPVTGEGAAATSQRQR